MSYAKERIAKIMSLIESINEQMSKETEGTERYKQLERRKRNMAQGFFPNEQDSYPLPTAADRAAEVSDFDLLTLDTFFTLFPEKILGEQVEGSGFLNPIRVKGELKPDVISQTISTSKPYREAKRASPKAKTSKAAAAKVKIKLALIKIEKEKLRLQLEREKNEV